MIGYLRQSRPSEWLTGILPRRRRMPRDGGPCPRYPISSSWAGCPAAMAGIPQRAVRGRPRTAAPPGAGSPRQLRAAVQTVRSSSSDSTKQQTVARHGARALGPAASQCSSAPECSRLREAIGGAPGARSGHGFLEKETPGPAFFHARAPFFRAIPDMAVRTMDGGPADSVVSYLTDSGYYREDGRA